MSTPGTTVTERAADGTLVATVPLRVEWIDTDAGGRIHFTAAFRWAELAEYELLRAAGSPVLTRFPRRHVEATFHLPLRFDDEFELEIRASHMGRTSVTYTWSALHDDQTCIEGSISSVLVDENGAPTPIPDELRRALTAPAHDTGSP